MQIKTYSKQETTKHRILHQEIELLLQVKSTLQSLKMRIIECIKLLEQQSGEQGKISKLVQEIRSGIRQICQYLQKSQSVLVLEISSRNSLKLLQQVFFKEVMKSYQALIYTLKNELLSIERKVQDLEQQGLNPYSNQPSPNHVLTLRKKNIDLNTQKAQLIINSCQQMIQQRCKKPLTCCFKSINNSKPEAQKQNIDTAIDLQLYKLTKHLFQCQLIKKKIIKEHQIKLRHNINNLNETNRQIKLATKLYNQKLYCEQIEALVRNGQMNINRQSAISFLREIHHSFNACSQNRNMDIPMCQLKSKSMSSPTLYLQQDEKREQKYNKEEIYLEDLGDKLTDSFLDQCSYLISERFISLQEKVVI